jgi:hypothetical protein
MSPTVGDERSVDVVRRMLELFMANDEEAWELWTDECHATIEQDWVEPGPFRGRDEIRAFWSSFDQAFGPDWTQGMSLDDIGLADEGVVANISLTAAGAASGVPLETHRVRAVFQVVDGRIARAEYSWAER